MGTSTVAGKAIRHLHELRDTLERSGYLAKVERPTSGPPFVRVTNPDARRLSEEIRCGRTTSTDDTLSFFWSWDDPICSADNLASAVDRITNVIGNRQ